MKIRLFIGDELWKEIEASMHGDQIVGQFYDHHNQDGSRLRMVFSKLASNAYTLIKVYPEGYLDANVNKMIQAKIGFTSDGG
jgi:hypothetical protein